MVQWLMVTVLVQILFSIYKRGGDDSMEYVLLAPKYEILYHDSAGVKILLENQRAESKIIHYQPPINSGFLSCSQSESKCTILQACCII